MSRLFGEIRQIAFVVEDIDTAMDFWTDTLGIGPFFVKRDIRFANFKYRCNETGSPRVSIALANSGFIQVELIQQQDNTPSIYLEFLQSGQQGLQHVSSWLTSTQLAHKKLELTEKGYEIAQECVIPSSGVQLVYFSTGKGAGKGAADVIFEISDLKEPGHYERVMGIKEASTNWDGGNGKIEVNV